MRNHVFKTTNDIYLDKFVQLVKISQIKIFKQTHQIPTEEKGQENRWRTILKNHVSYCIE